MTLLRLRPALSRRLRSAPVALAERKRLLEEVVIEAGRAAHLRQLSRTRAKQMLEAARENGLEGILAKHAQSCYESRRSREWLKIKIVDQQEFVICGFTDPGRARSISARWCSACTSDGKLHWVGNVGTGFDRRLLAGIARRLDTLVTQAVRSPNVRSPTGA